ncbi:ParA family partition ATPase [Sneathiella aquimaris]|uniref:ParA family partition ATPase n=1 Tax=Sneathiella aquimaris TaxID=2599305 RepID=UPI00146C0BA2|nr:ParA family partition ATPase [Sneathiella aquimaris]
MKIISLLAQKGGAGKTTLTVHLAVLAASEGNRVLLVDTDPQKSTGDWWREREADEPGLVEITADKIPNVIEAAKEAGVEFVFIDTAPHAEPAAYAASKAADLVLIPTRPSILDLRAIGATTNIIQDVGTNAAIVLNSCPPSRGYGEATLIKEAREALTAYEVPVCPIAIIQRAAMAHSLIDGHSVFEYEPDGKAADEIRKLWNWTKEQLNG